MHQTMSGVFPNEILRVLKIVKNTLKLRCHTVKHSQEKNTFHLKIQCSIPTNLINKGSKTTYSENKQMGISTWTRPLRPLFRLYNTKAMLHRSISYNLTQLNVSFQGVLEKITYVLDLQSP